MNVLMSLIGGAHGKFNLVMPDLTNSAILVGTPCISNLTWDQDGNVYRIDNGGTPTSGGDWGTPDSEAANYPVEMRFVNLAGDTGGVSSRVAEDVWHPLATSDFWVELADTDEDIGTVLSVTFDVEARFGSSGAAIETSSHTLTANSR